MTCRWSTAAWSFIACCPTATPWSRPVCLALVTVSNELGEPRYPTLRGIMTAGRKTPTVWTAADLGVAPASLAPKVRVVDLAVPVVDRECEIVSGETDADAGRALALRLREDGLI